MIIEIWYHVISFLTEQEARQLAWTNREMMKIVMSYGIPFGLQYLQYQPRAIRVNEIISDIVVKPTTYPVPLERLYYDNNAALLIQSKHSYHGGTGQQPQLTYPKIGIALYEHKLLKLGNNIFSDLVELELRGKIKFDHALFPSLKKLILHEYDHILPKINAPKLQVLYVSFIRHEHHDYSETFPELCKLTFAGLYSNNIYTDKITITCPKLREFVYTAQLKQRTFTCRLIGPTNIHVTLDHIDMLCEDNHAVITDLTILDTYHYSPMLINVKSLTLQSPVTRDSIILSQLKQLTIMSYCKLDNLSFPILESLVFMNDGSLINTHMPKLKHLVTVISTNLIDNITSKPTLEVVYVQIDESHLQQLEELFPRIKFNTNIY